MAVFQGPPRSKSRAAAAAGRCEEVTTAPRLFTLKARRLFAVVGCDETFKTRYHTCDLDQVESQGVRKDTGEKRPAAAEATTARSRAA